MKNICTPFGGDLPKTNAWYTYHSIQAYDYENEKKEKIKIK